MNGIAGTVPSALFTQLKPSVSQAVSAAANGYGKCPAALIATADEALMQLHAAHVATQAGVKAAGKQEGAPQLRAPTVGVSINQENYSSEAQLLKLLAELGEILGEASMTSIVSQLKAFLARAAVAVAASETLSKESAETLAKAEQAVEDLSTATTAAATAAAKESEATEVRDELASQLEAMDPEAPEYAALKGKLEKAEAALTSAAAAAAAANKAIIPLQAKADDAIADFEAVRQKVNGLARDPLAKAPDEAELSHAAVLSQMLALLNEISSKAQIHQLEAETRYAVEVIQRSVEANMKRSEEYEAQVEKARHAEKTMGCVGKWLGWVLTAVMTVAAPFTGGASMILAGVFLAMAIVEETTGFSVVGEALKPVMEHVIQPLIKALTKIFTEALMAVGVSADVAEKIAMALAAIAVAAIMIAAFIGIRSAASKLFGPLMKSLGRQIAKVMPTFSEQAASRAGKVIAAAEIGSALQETGQGAGQIVIADMNVKGTRLLAIMATLKDGIRGMQEYTTRLEDLYARANAAEAQLSILASDVLRGEYETGTSVINRMRHA